MILAGDIGGTKTLLALFADASSLSPMATESFSSRGRSSFDPLIEEFLSCHAPDEPVTSACLGVAGPVIANRCRTTNLPFFLDGAELARTFGIGRVELVNDLTATAEGIAVLEPGDLVELLAGGGDPDPSHPAGLLAAGTGLGMAVLAPSRDGRWRPLPSEGSHVELGPRNEEEDALLRFLRRLYPEHVSVERVVSGPGLLTLYRFLESQGVAAERAIHEAIRADQEAAPAIISEHGLDGRCRRCRRALELFVSLLGAAAGNLALTLVATGGIFIGGGIPPRILPALHWEIFRSSFVSKGRYRELLESIPVQVITEPRTALLGAAVRARRGA